MDTETTVKVLSTLTTRDHAGVHFTANYEESAIEELESLGLIEIDRPVHEATGYPYQQEYWSVEVTEEGRQLVDAYPEYWDTTA